MKLHQTNELVESKETSNIMKRKTKEWERILVDYISHKALISRVFKESNGKQTNNPI